MLRPLYSSTGSRARTTNDYGKTAEERELIRGHLADVEPLLRATCTHEIDATQPIEKVVAELVAIGAGSDQAIKPPCGLS